MDVTRRISARARTAQIVRQGFWLDVAKAPEIPVDSVALVSGRPIKRWLYRNTVSYFMRLPDGSPQGTGYVATA